MRVDLITMHGIKNYGSALQTFATQEFFKQFGCDVKVINYVRKDAREENLLNYWCKGNKLKEFVMRPTLIRWKKVFNGFYDQYVNISEGIFSAEDDFKEYPLNADMYCTGSDQVWNSKWNLGIELPLYLSFVPKNKYKFAFSSSFGQDHLADEEIRLTKKYIDQYKYISVRESSGKKIIEQQYGYPKAYHLIDPSLCLDAKSWRKFSGKRKIKGDYILVYNLNRSKEFDDYAVKLSKKAGIKLIRLCTRYDQFYRAGKSILIPEVLDFINLIDNAKYVLTDSFHATAFSMNLNTEPICVYPSEFGGRLESFLELVRSEQRHVSNFSDFDVLNRKTDFDAVNCVLDNERLKACQYMSMVISDYNSIKNL